MLLLDEIRTGISMLAIIISIISLKLSRRSWLQSNRPIVTAFVQEHSSGNKAAAFDLVVSNTGNRPATQIKISAGEEDIYSLVDEKASKELKDRIKNCFSKDSEIPVLRNGEDLKTSFGAYSPNEPGKEWLNYGKAIPIEITYNDLEGRFYRSQMPLKIFAREGFGGGVWEKKEN